MNEKEIGLVYFCIYKKLIKKAEKTNDKIIKRSAAFEIFGKGFHINKELRSFVLKELELFGFLKSSTDKFLYINKVKDFEDMKRKRILAIKKMF